MPQPDLGPGKNKQKMLERSSVSLIMQVDTAFNTFDTNSDGLLNYKEFCIMISRKEQER